MANTTLYIIKFWIFESKNASQIFPKIQNDYPGLAISQAKINEILDKMRNIITYYYKDIYEIEDISNANAKENSFKMKFYF